MRLLAVLGSATAPGRLRRAVAEALERAAGGAVELIDLAERRIAPADGRPPDQLGDDTQATLAAIAGADAVVLATPVYRGSLTGTLKNLLDHVPVEALGDKPVAIVAMGATRTTSWAPSATSATSSPSSARSSPRRSTSRARFRGRRAGRARRRASSTPRSRPRSSSPPRARERSAPTRSRRGPATPSPIDRGLEPQAVCAQPSSASRSSAAKDRRRARGLRFVRRRRVRDSRRWATGCVFCAGWRILRLRRARR